MPNMIPFLDLKRINQPYENEIQAAIAEVLTSGWFVLGKNVAEFEQNFADRKSVV